MLKYSANVVYRLGENFTVEVSYPELNTKSIKPGYAFTGIKEQDQCAIKDCIRYELNQLMSRRTFINLNQETSGEVVYEVDPDDEIRIRFSNWFIEQTTYVGIYSIIDHYLPHGDVVTDDVTLITGDQITALFDLFEYFDIGHLMEVARVFKIPADYLKPQN